MITENTRDELKQKLDHPKQSVLVESLPAERCTSAGCAQHSSRPSAGPCIGTDSPGGDGSHRESAGPTCHASENAARELTDLGYSNLRHYAGGKQDWQDTGLPIVSDYKHRAA